MNDLKTLLELNPDYPPSEATWSQILNLVLGKKEKPMKGMDKVRYSLLLETQALERSGGYSQNTLTNGTGMTELPTGARTFEVNPLIRTTSAPALPEPTVIRFYYQDHPYYLDGKDQIYKADPNQTLVAHLVGKIENNQVIIKDQVVHELKTKFVSPKEIHGRAYYLGKNFEAYRGLLPKKRYLWQVGKLNDKGKLELL